MVTFDFSAVAKSLVVQSRGQIRQVVIYQPVFKIIIGKLR